MKNYKSLVLAFVLLVFAAGCKKEETADVSKTVKVSYPTITLKGDSAISVTPGGTYTDPGAVLTDDISGAKSDITATDNPVDPSTPGLYFVKYEASNSNGFTTTVYRPVAVTNVPESADLSGTYLRDLNGAPATWTKVARGLYINSNVGGVLPLSHPAVLPVYVVHLNDSTIEIPEQPVPNGYGTLYVSAPKLSISPTDTSYSYIVRNIGFGTARRTFIKE